MNEYDKKYSMILLAIKLVKSIKNKVDSLDQQKLQLFPKEKYYQLDVLYNSSR